MNFKEYQEKAIKTAIYPMPIIYPALAVNGEAGEIAEKVKKVLRDNNGEFTQEKKESIAKEIGDVLWYLANLASDMDMSLDDIAKQNIDKINKRQKSNTLHGNGDDRETSKEENYYAKFLDNELKLINGRINPFVIKCLPEIKSILNKACNEGWSGASAPFYINAISKTINRALSFKPITPLTFGDDEWNIISYKENCYQNRRCSNIFKNITSNGEDCIYNINAISHKYSKRYDLETNTFSKGSQTLWNGTIYLYNEDKGKWVVCTNGQLTNFENFYGDENFVIDTIELYNSSDRHNDFFAHIANIKDVPKDFFKRYKFLSDNIITEELTFLIGNTEIIDLVKK